MKDPLRLNDWNIYPFLGIVLAIQAAVLLILGLRGGGIDTSLAGQVVLFVYLAYVPGLLVLRAAGVHGRGSAETSLYAVGLSLATLMLAGVAVNLFLPAIGYSMPITLGPLAIALTIIVLALCLLSYLLDRDYRGNATIELSLENAPQALLLLLLPFLAIFGTYLMNHSDDNVLLLAMIAAIAAIVLLVGAGRVIPKELFALAIFVMGLTLLFHNSLISDSLVGWDIHLEKSLADSVIQNGVWTVSMNSILNSMLSIVMLAPIFSIFLQADTTWVYKVIFPLLFALVPVALYQAYRKQSDERVAFMAAFFFMALVVFFSEMLQLARQEIAELFLALILMLIVDRSMDKARWSALFLVFSAGLVLSHYGLTFVFIAMIVTAWLLLYVVSKISKDSARDMNRRLTPLLVLGLVVFCGIWYVYTSSASPLTTGVDVAHEIEQPIADAVNDALAPPAPAAAAGTTTAQGTTAATSDVTQPIKLIETGGSSSPLHKLFLALLVLTQLVLVVGVLSALVAGWGAGIRREFYALALTNTAMLGVALVLPYFASALNTTRLYQIALIVLAPFFVLGWVNIFKAAGKVTGRSMKGTMAVAIGALAIFMVLYLVFNTGLVFEVASDVPMSYSLDRQGANVSYTVYNGMEVAGAEWTFSQRDAAAASQNMTYVPPIFSDTYRWLLLEDWNTSRSYLLPEAIADTPPSSYVYMGTYNVLDDQAIDMTTDGETSNVKLVDMAPITDQRDRIYSNGGAEVYY